MGILRNMKLPAVIEAKNMERWKQLIARDYLNVNYLSKYASVNLINDKLEHWNLKVNADEIEFSLNIFFHKEKTKMNVLEIRRNSYDTNYNLEMTLKCLFMKNVSVYRFVKDIARLLRK